MHKKRSVIVTAIFLIIILAIVIIASDNYKQQEAEKFISALKIMRSNPDAGFDLCNQISFTDYAKDCYTTYLSVEIEIIRDRYKSPVLLGEKEQKEQNALMLNEITEKVNKVCSIKLMSEESETCASAVAILDVSRQDILSS